MKLRSSLIALGVGAAAYQYARKQDVFSRRNMKRARKMLRSYL
ncbi:YrzQ family protein [Bacillus sp. JJ864]